MIITRATPHQHPRGRVAIITAAQSRSAATLPKPCLWREAVPPHFVSSSGKFLALTVKKSARRTSSVETRNGRHQRRR